MAEVANLVCFASLATLTIGSQSDAGRPIEPAGSTFLIWVLFAVSIDEAIPLALAQNEKSIILTRRADQHEDVKQILTWRLRPTAGP